MRTMGFLPLLLKPGNYQVKKLRLAYRVMRHHMESATAPRDVSEARLGRLEKLCRGPLPSSHSCQPPDKGVRTSEIDQLQGNFQLITETGKTDPQSNEESSTITVFSQIFWSGLLVGIRQLIRDQKGIGILLFWPSAMSCPPPNTHQTYKSFLNPYFH